MDFRMILLGVIMALWLYFFNSFLLDTYSKVLVRKGDGEGGREGKE